MRIKVVVWLSSAAFVNCSSLFGKDPSGLDQALKVLDTNSDGKVDRAEVAAFAKAQGLSDDDVREEFKDIDLNGNGELEVDEIRSTLKVSVGSASADDTALSSVAAAPAKVETQKVTAQKEIAVADKVIPVKDEVTAKEVSARKTEVVEPKTVPVPLVVEDPAANLKDVQDTANSVAAETSKVSAIRMHIDQLSLEAQQHAGKALAEVFARTAAKGLEARKQDAQKAEQLEEQAKGLRQQSAEIKAKAASDTIKAATDAANVVLQRTHEKVRALEEEAAKAETDAAESRRKAKVAMKKALSAQADMAASVADLEGDGKQQSAPNGSG